MQEDNSMKSRTDEGEENVQGISNGSDQWNNEDCP